MYHQVSTSLCVSFLQGEPITIFGSQGYKGSKGDPVSLTLIDFLSFPFPTVGDISTEHSLG